MAHIHNITIRAEYQGFICEKIEKDDNGKNIFRFRINRQSTEVACPYCGGNVSGNGMRKVRLTDIPLLPGIPSIYEIHQHKYRCRNCGKTHTELNPFKVQGFQLTKRCVE